jgi:hypothetical protein
MQGCRFATGSAVSIVWSSSSTFRDQEGTWIGLDDQAAISVATYQPGCQRAGATKRDMQPMWNVGDIRCEVLPELRSEIKLNVESEKK